MLLDKTDREWIENKYHRTDEPFDPLNRMAYHGIGYAEETGMDDEEILTGLKMLQPSLSTMPHPVARAMAIKYVLETERLYINEHDHFVGLYSLGRLANSVTSNVWQGETQKKRDPATLKNAGLFNESGAVANWTDYDHVVPDWESLMRLGFTGVKERAQEYRKKHLEDGTLTEEMAAFFDGIAIEYDAIIALIDRMYRYAVTLRHKKAARIAGCLETLRDGAPTDIYEAMQLILLYFVISESVDGFQVRSLGNGLVRTLYRFYENDLKTGKYTREEIRTLLAYFLLQWSAIGNYWGQPFYLGGTTPDGRTRYNALSDDILAVYDDLGIYNPKIQLKINRNTPDRILDKALDMVRRKNASLVFCCEPGMIKAVMGYGATYEEALDMDIRGCYETGVRANEACAGEGYINAAKAVEYVFSNGFDKRINQQVGIRTGGLAALGRKNGDILSKNGSPSDGMDKNGVTALIESAVKLTPSNFCEVFCLDSMLLPSAVEGEDGLAVFKALLKTYMEQGEMAVQFNIFRTEALRDAQKNPEKYKNLQVRVCGWNVLWNNLSREEQEAYIRRAENIG